MNKNDRKELIRMAIGCFAVAFSVVCGILVAGYVCKYLFRIITFSFSFI